MCGFACVWRPYLSINGLLRCARRNLPMTVYAFDPDRVTNAQLIRDCAELGYLQEDWLTLDPTYGKGRFWKLWQPAILVITDKYPVPYVGDDGHWAPSWLDFTDMPPGWSDKFDAVVFDPPYKLNGTGGSHPSDEGYGVADKLTIDDRHKLMEDGLRECIRVTKPNGFILVKCQDQVSSGKVQWQTRLMIQAATARISEDDDRPKTRLVDMLFVCGGIEQPKGRRQVHARRNYSTCLVFQKAKR